MNRIFRDQFNLKTIHMWTRLELVRLGLALLTFSSHLAKNNALLRSRTSGALSRNPKELLLLNVFYSDGWLIFWQKSGALWRVHFAVNSGTLCANLLVLFYGIDIELTIGYRTQQSRRIKNCTRGQLITRNRWLWSPVADRKWSLPKLHRTMANIISLKVVAPPDALFGPTNF